MATGTLEASEFVNLKSVSKFFRTECLLTSLGAFPQVLQFLSLTTRAQPHNTCNRNKCRCKVKESKVQTNDQSVSHGRSSRSNDVLHTSIAGPVETTWGPSQQGSIGEFCHKHALRCRNNINKPAAKKLGLIECDFSSTRIALEENRMSDKIQWGIVLYLYD